MAFESFQCQSRIGRPTPFLTRISVQGVILSVAKDFAFRFASSGPRSHSFFCAPAAYCHSEGPDRFRRDHEESAFEFFLAQKPTNAYPFPDCTKSHIHS